MSKTAQGRSSMTAPKAELRLRKDESGWNMSLRGIVGDDWDGFTDQQVQDVLEGIPANDSLTVYLNSPGGAVFQGIPIHNALARHKGHVRIVIDGLAASMGSDIAMAGDTVAMYPSSMMMIHNPWSISIGDSQVMRKDADMLDKVREALLGAYQGKSGQDRDTLIAMMDEETWLTAAEAVEWGFADEIIETDKDDAQASIADLDLSILPNIPNNIAQMVAQHRIAGHPRSARPAPAAESSKQLTEAVMADPVKTQAEPTAAETTTTAENHQMDESKIRDEATKAGAKAERKRVAEIQRAVRAAKLDSAFADELVEAGVSVEDARAKIIDKWADQDNTPEIDNHAHVELVADAADKQRGAMVQAIMSRAKVAKMDSSNEFRGMRTLDMARDSLDRAGVKTRGMTPMEVVAAAFTHSTSDFSVVLEDAMHKTLLNGYESVADTWRRFCAVGNLTDFRPHYRYRMGSFGNLETVNENGEFKHGTLSDADREQIQGDTKGKLLSLSRKMIINDDLGAFLGVAQKMGRAAARTVEIDVYAMLAANSGSGPTMGDGTTLFHADHGNLTSSGSAPTMTGFEAMRVLMAQQQDKDSNDYLDLRPSLWLGPIGIGGQARQTNAAEYDDEAQKNQRRPNISRGLVSDVVDTPRLSGTAHYMFADPTDEPVFEVGFLDGEETPFLDVQDGFTVDGATYKVRLDYGVAAVGWRGAVKNPGV